jgi:outer membrane protein OmpA-like peptidoglycan-associated protein
MKRLLTSTTALSLVLTPLGVKPAIAQILSENGSVLAIDGTILCDGSAGEVCDPALFVEQAAEIEARVMAEEAAAEEQRLQAEAAAAEEERLQAEAVAAEEQRLQAEAAAAEEERLQAEAAPAEEQRLQEEAAAAVIVPQPLAEPEVVKEPELLVEHEVNTEDVVQPVDPTTGPELAVEPALPAEIILPDAPVNDPAAGLKEAEPLDLSLITPIEAVTPEETQVEALSEILVEPTESMASAPLAAEMALPFVEPAPPEATSNDGSLAEPIEIVPLSQVPVADGASVVTQTLTEANVRSSTQEFAAAPVTLSDGRRSGLTDFEKVGLVALGALVVGAIISEGRKEERRVVSNTGDRVVVLRPDGTYQVLKDDDTVLRRPGSTVRTETFNDGSTRTIVQRTDGSQIVTIRDASGRVLRRAQYDRLGRERVLIDDFQDEEPVIIRDLPRPKKDRVVISSKDADAALKARMAALEAKKARRGFSLRQIREISEVRDLAAMIDVDSITFDSGSAAIKAGEAEGLADLGQLMQELLEENPGEMFLIEGHTDAVGHPAMNLSLSDRRAESVALALAEYFDIPPENLIVQGYGESELLVDTQRDERANRRVVVRVITPLLKQRSGG